MNPQQDIIHTYQSIIQEADEKLKNVKQQIYRIGTLRLVLFAAGIAGTIYYWTSGALILTCIIAATLIPFLFLIKRHNRLFYQREYLEKKIEINQQELNAVGHDFSSFDGGKAFIDPAHLYTYDLDVFGDHSLFQCINRTSTEMGMKRLADWFNQHLKDKDKIEERQEAVKELAPEIKIRQRFRILGLLHKGTPADVEEIRRWVAAPNLFRSRRWLRALPPLALLTNTVFIALATAGICPSSIAGVIFVAFIAISFTFSHKISKTQVSYSKRLQILTTYARQIRIIEELAVNTSALKAIQAKVGNEKEKASQAVEQLNRLMNALDQRNNIFVAAFLNGLYFWELWQMMRIETWKESHAKELPQWLEAIGEMDAYCSLSTFAYNHPEYQLPKISTDAFRIEAKALGHPLMRHTNCVRNDIRIEKRPYFLIVTGANMAGKSTYLRTVGVNYLLACMGAPVWADCMEIYPTQLITSLRTSDSLTDNESYFFAELKRLKLIIDKLKQGEEMFIILDEILKGTNSVDKQKGSIALVKQLISLQANGVIATHDLLLGSLAEVFPDNVRNHCFEADIIDNELTFSYAIREGIAQNMNACFLMKKMGIALIE